MTKISLKKDAFIK